MNKYWTLRFKCIYERAYTRSYYLYLLLMKFLSAIINLLPLSKKAIPSKVNKILIVKPDHLGDVFMSTSVLPHIKKKYPDADIDVICGPWAVPIFSYTGLVNQIFSIRHFLLNRARISRIKKIVIFLYDLIVICFAMRGKKYDLCLLLRAYHSNLVLTTKLVTNCKCVVGHDCLGFGKLIDVIVDWKKGISEVEHFFEILSSIGIIVNRKDIYPVLPIYEEDKLFVERLLEGYNLKDEKFSIIHPGTGEPARRLSILEWEKALKYIKDDKNIVVVGLNEEKDFYSWLAGELKGNYVVDFTSQLNLRQLYYLFSKASKTLALESLASHMASVVCKKVYVLWKSENDPMQWSPFWGDVEIVIINN